mmetsp:Transcript_60084/g.143159  ORF Transcript_60084/g.143159 Transcript_60084/m.143159 type:complete len:634 (+) Transcript_60084:57-1958(+)
MPYGPYLVTGRSASKSFSFAKTPGRPAGPVEDFWVDLKRWGQRRDGARPRSARGARSRPGSARRASGHHTTTASADLEEGSPSLEATRRSTLTASESLSGLSTTSRARAVPVEELVPDAVAEDVLHLARKARRTMHTPAVIVEMQWGSSTYTAHNNGEKYSSVFREIRDTLLTKAIEVRCLSSSALCGQPAFFDRFSMDEPEQNPGAIPSNVSFASAAPSRIGAFEVHVVQGTWDAATCCPVELDDDMEHSGALVCDRGMMLCMGCYEHLQGTQSPSSSTTSRARPQEQRTLLHSKLWTRRWPNLTENLLPRIGAAVIPPAPQVPMNIPGFLHIPCEPADDFKALSAQLLELPKPFDPVELADEALKALDCPAQKGWFVKKAVAGEGLGVLCSCGGGSHDLTMQQAIDLLGSFGFDRHLLRNFIDDERGKWEGKLVNDMLHTFMRGSSVKLNPRARDAEAKLAELRALHHELSQKMDQLCDDYKSKYETAVDLAKRLVMDYCVLLVKQVPAAKLIESPTSVVEALEALKAAIRINDDRAETWGEWRQEANLWLDVPRAYELRPDLSAVLQQHTVIAATARRISEAAEELQENLQELYPDRASFEARLAEIHATWSDAVAEFESLCGQPGTAQA